MVGDDVKAFIESGVAVVVGTADGEGRPHAVMAWGPRVEAQGGLLRVFIDDATGEATFADLVPNARVAVTFGSPVSYRSLQVKGRLRELRPALGEEGAWVERHQEAFAVETALVGDPPHLIRNTWRQDATYTAIAVDIEAMFDQTPGPDAGRPL